MAEHYTPTIERGAEQDQIDGEERFLVEPPEIIRMNDQEDGNPGAEEDRAIPAGSTLEVSEEEALKNRIAALTAQARRHAAEIQASKIIAQNELNIAPNTPSDYTHTFSHEHGGATGLRRSKRLLSLRLAGCKKSSEVLPLVEYIEATIPHAETKYLHIKTADYEKTKAKYEKQGWRVGPLSTFGEDLKKETSISIEKTTRTSITSKKAVELETLLGLPNDPATTIQNLRQIGFSISDHDLTYHLDSLRELLTNPNVPALIDKFAQISITRSFHLGKSYDGQNVTQQFCELADQDSQQNILTPEVISRLNTFKTISYGSARTIDELRPYIDQVKDGDAYDLYSKVSDSLPWRSNAGALEVFKAISQAGLIPRINQLLDLNLIRADIIPDSLFKNSDETDVAEPDIESIRKIIEEQINSPELQSILEDRELVDFIYTATTLLNTKFSLPQIDQYKKLKEIPESLAVIELFSHWDKSLKSGKDILSDDKYIEALRNPEKVKIITDPEFDKFLLHLQNELGFEFYIFELINNYANGDVIDIFKDDETREILLSPESAPLINYLGKPSPKKIPNFIELLKIPNILPVLQRVETSFGYHYSPGDYKSEITPAVRLCNDDELQNNLFREDTTRLFKTLQEKFGYSFNFNEIDSLLAIRDNPEQQSELLDDANVDFVNSAIGNENKSSYYSRGIEFLQSVTDIDPVLQPIIVQFHELYGYNISFKDLEKIEEISQNDELQRLLLDQERVSFAKEIKKIGPIYGNLDLSEIIDISALPLDFNNFLAQLNTLTEYKFKTDDLPILAVFAAAENHERIIGFLGSLKENSIGYKFQLQDVNKLTELNAVPLESIQTLLVALKENMSYDSFDLHDIETFKYLIENNIFDSQQIKSLTETYKKFDTTTEPITTSVLAQIHDFQLNKEAFEPLSQKLIELGIRFDPIRNTDRLRQIIDNDLLPLIEFSTENGWSFTFNHLDGFIAFRNDPSYEDMINAFLTINKYATPRPFDIQKASVYRSLAQVENLEAVLQNLPAEILNSIYNDREALLIVGLNGDTAKFQQIDSARGNPYFKDTKDASNNLKSFLSKFDAGIFSAEEVHTILTTSGDPRKTRKFMNKAVALRGINKYLADGEKSEMDFREKNKDYVTYYAETAHHLSQSATRLLFKEESPEKTADIGQRLEARLSTEPPDEIFEDNFRVIIDSVAIMADKYNPTQYATQDKFLEEMRAIQQSLELVLTPDPQQYTEQRLSHSQAQFDRLGAELPETNIEELIQLWADLGSPVRASLDATTYSQKEILYSKLSTVKTVFEREIVPDLTELFLRKVAILKESVSSGNSNPIEPLKLELFQKYLLNDDGTPSTNIKGIYRELTREAQSNEEILRAQDTTKEDKARIGQRQSVLNKMREVMASLIRLGDVDPHRIDSNLKYTQIIDRMTESLAINLQSLGIVGKPKTTGQEQEDILEVDVRDHLSELANVIQEKDHPLTIETQSQFVTDFNSLARCPEFTLSCQRLTEGTGHNQAAYSRIIDGINELIDLHQIKTQDSPRGAEVEIQEVQRLARCMTELSAFKEDVTDEPKAVVLMDRPYIHPDHVAFTRDLIHNMFETILRRLQDYSEVSVLVSSQFRDNIAELDGLINSYGYQITPILSGQYYVNESNLKMTSGKYYDSIRGLEDTTQSHYAAMNNCYLLEKVDNPQQ